MAQVWGRSDREQPNEPDRDNRIGPDSEGNTVRTLRSPRWPAALASAAHYGTVLKNISGTEKDKDYPRPLRALGRKRPPEQSSGWQRINLNRLGVFSSFSVQKFLLYRRLSTP